MTIPVKHIFYKKDYYQADNVARSLLRISARVNQETSRVADRWTASASCALISRVVDRWAIMSQAVSAGNPCQSRLAHLPVGKKRESEKKSFLFWLSSEGCCDMQASLNRCRTKFYYMVFYKLVSSGYLFIAIFFNSTACLGNAWLRILP